VVKISGKAGSFPRLYPTGPFDPDPSLQRCKLGTYAGPQKVSKNRTKNSDWCFSFTLPGAEFPILRAQAPLTLSLVSGLWPAYIHSIALSSSPRSERPGVQPCTLGLSALSAPLSHCGLSY